MKTGILDSGIGGLTVLHQALQTLPNEDYLYYADTDHVPYGTKTKEEITGYADEAVLFLAQKGVQAVVVACNTATSAAIGFLRSKYAFPILGMEPAVKPAVRRNAGKRVMVVATPVTIREDRLQNLLRRVDGEHSVDLLALPRLVTLAESGEFNSDRVRRYLEDEFSRYDLTRYSALVLGCTHFNFFKDTFRRIFPPDVALIDGSAGTVNHLRDVLRENGLAGGGSGRVEYYQSGRRLEDRASLERIRALHRRLDAMLRY